MDIFCTRQQISLLHDRNNPRPHLAGETFWRERHDPARPDGRPWQPWDREAIIQAVSAGGNVKRLSVICFTGLGKTTNLDWMSQALAGPKSRQVPFLFRLDGKAEKDKMLPANEEEFRTTTLVHRIRNKLTSGSLSDARLLFAIERLRELGRITLLFDSIDQAGAINLAMVRGALPYRGQRSAPCRSSNATDVPPRGASNKRSAPR